MNKKLRLIVLSVLLCVGMFAPISANSGTITEKADEGAITEKQDVPESEVISNPATEDFNEIEEMDENLTDLAETVDSSDKKSETYAVAITNEAELIAAIASATSGDTITIEGGTKIELTKALTIQSASQGNLKFVSSNNEEVIIVNANGKRHIEILGTNAINLDFSNIVLSGNLTAGYTKGGIQILNNEKGNRINGLIVRDNIADGGWDEGVIKYKGTNGSIELSNLSFINNEINNWSTASSSILLIDSKNSDIIIDKVNFDGNKTQNQNGSALGIYNDNGIATISDLKIVNGTAKSNSAGVKYIGYMNSSLNVKNSHFSNNVNTSGTAGAFLLTLKAASNADFYNVEFINNYGDRGGGALEAVLENSGSFTLDTVNFTGNSASRIKYNPETGEQTGLPSSGGALSVTQRTNKSTMTIKNSKFIGNEASTAGALNIANGSPGFVTVLVDNTIFDGNTSDYTSGAIYLSTGSSLPESVYTFKNTEIINNTVTGNDPGPGYNEGGQGGGIYLADNPQVLALDSVKFGNNKSKYPVLWNYSESDTTYPNPTYLKNVTNTTEFTTPVQDYIEKYNNAYNGDDVYITYSAITYLYLNEDEIADLVVDNYAEMNNYYFSILNSKVVEPIEPTATGYTFLGWYDVNGEKWDFDTMSQTVVHNYLSAKWEKLPEIYTVTYTDGTGEELVFADKQIEVVDGEATPLYTDVIERYGYTFEGWSPTLSSTVTENVTYVAQWKELDKFTVTYTDGANGEVFKDQVATVYINEKSPVYDGEEPTRTGYTFKGWSPEYVETVKENIIYTAQWEQNTFTVIYTDGTGKELVFADMQFEIAEGEATPQYTSALERYGYTFEGWSPALSSTVTEDVTYVAQWKELDKFTVTYTDGVNGEAFQDQITTVYFNEVSPRFNGTPIREGYVFMGWSPEYIEAVTENIVYIAQWQAIEVEEVPVLPSTGISNNYLGIQILVVGVLLLSVGISRRKIISK
ncbi:InlB B-repeat-containing protein [Erysipelothrix sp. HDW6A]|uniref:InlB B-repeat-containing protein n=1 Tax=Erysipelothrix sp. HDW6A TaxID=2714928 RepID=UPI0014088216|nr:InlB B-repeat-containing protein [Erysipelothrix sp. HDW6A]QIK56809.1 InlB B-repeat-containing protein [Erysipelothrix sp. HDW6A]